MRSNQPQVDQLTHLALIRAYILVEYISLLHKYITKKDSEIYTHSNDWDALSDTCSQIRLYLQFDITIRSQSKN